MYSLLAQVDIPKTFVLDSNKSTKVADVFGSPAALIQAFLPQVYLFAGLFVFVLLIGGGLRIITSAGDPKATEGGKKAIGSALIGFGIILSSYWIIQIVEIVTGVKIFNSQL